MTGAFITYHYYVLLLLMCVVTCVLHVCECVRVVCVNGLEVCMLVRDTYACKHMGAPSQFWLKHPSRKFSPPLALGA